MTFFRNTFALSFASLGFLVVPSACNSHTLDEDPSAPPEGFARFPSAEPEVDQTTGTGPNPWIVGFGGAGPTDGGQIPDPLGQGSTSGSVGGGAPVDPDVTTGAGGVGGRESGSTEEPDDSGSGSGSGGDSEQPLPLLERRLDRYMEGEGSDKLLGLWGETGASPVECRIEIYSNGGIEPWRTIVLPSELPEDGFLTLCSLPENHPECTSNMSGSLYNGNDALVIRCGEVVMDSFGRVGEDPGVAWASENGTLRSEGQDLVRCGTASRTDPFAPFSLADEWVRAENGESAEEARLKCALFEAPVVGGAGAPAL